MNWYAVRAIYRFEMARTFRTLMQSIASPVLSTSLYFVVFGSAIGSRMGDVDGVSYGAFIVPGLVMLSLLNESVSNAAFGIYMPKWAGTMFELLSAPVSFAEVILGYVGAATTKSVMLGGLILVTARIFVPYEIAHPFWMLCFLTLTAVSFSLFGFILGLWADSFEKLQIVPMMVLTPLTFLGGAFYSINMLPPLWQKVALANPVVYLISGFRWSFYDIADVNVGVSVAAIFAFLIVCLVTIGWIWRTVTHQRRRDDLHGRAAQDLPFHQGGGAWAGSRRSKTNSRHACASQRWSRRVETWARGRARTGSTAAL